MTALAVFFGLAFAISTLVALSYRDECKQWRAHHSNAMALYDQCVALELYNNHLEARIRMTNNIHASGMMYAGWVNVSEKMKAIEAP